MDKIIIISAAKWFVKLCNKPVQLIIVREQTRLPRTQSHTGQCISVSVCFLTQPSFCLYLSVLRVYQGYPWLAQLGSSLSFSKLVCELLLFDRELAFSLHHKPHFAELTCTITVHRTVRLKWPQISCKSLTICVANRIITTSDMLLPLSQRYINSCHTTRNSFCAIIHSHTLTSLTQSLISIWIKWQ